MFLFSFSVFLSSGVLKPKGSVYTDFDSSTEVAEVESIDASSLEGHAASYFATAAIVSTLQEQILEIQQLIIDIESRLSVLEG